jgi:hypothetical protein
VIQFLHWLWERILADGWPPDDSRIAPNIVASVVQWIIVAAVMYAIWPRFRHALDHWIKGHLHQHHIEHSEAIKAHLDAHMATLRKDLGLDKPTPVRKPTTKSTKPVVPTKRAATTRPKETKK